jgi:peptidoglycan-associated lipoprotein
MTTQFKGSTDRVLNSGTGVSSFNLTWGICKGAVPPCSSFSKLIVAALAVASLWGCASQSTKDEGKAGVEDRTPSAVTAPAATPITSPQQPSTVTVQPLGSGAAGGANPLKDPNNILSKRSIFYDYDSDAIKDEFKPVLAAHAKYLSGNRQAKVLLQGNTDERGSREYNIALGQRRAEAAKRILVLQGAQESQVEAVSLGEEKPRCEAQNEECWAQNRRSDILYGGEY